MTVAERVTQLEAAAEAVMAAIDARPPAVASIITYRLYIAPSGRKYVTVVGTLGARAFAEVLAPVSDDLSWDATIAAAVAREAQPT